MIVNLQKFKTAMIEPQRVNLQYCKYHSGWVRKSWWNLGELFQPHSLHTFAGNKRWDFSMKGNEFPLLLQRHLVVQVLIFSCLDYHINENLHFFPLSVSGNANKNKFPRGCFITGVVLIDSLLCWHCEEVGKIWILKPLETGFKSWICQILELCRLEQVTESFYTSTFYNLFASLWLNTLQSKYLRRSI